MNPELKRANIQRLISLENAFKTIDAFAIPSLCPDDCNAYENIKNKLIDKYAEGITEEEKKDYRFEDE